MVASAREGLVFSLRLHNPYQNLTVNAVGLVFAAIFTEIRGLSSLTGVCTFCTYALKARSLLLKLFLPSFSIRAIWARLCPRSRERRERREREGREEREERERREGEREERERKSRIVAFSPCEREKEEKTSMPVEKRLDPRGGKYERETQH